MKFFLIGFMGAGKTTLGRHAAKQHGLHFVDLDAYIEQKAGTTVREIFREKGEDFFRQLERKALEEVCAIEGLDLLVSCGGGTPCFFDNMAMLNAHGHTMYLDMSAARLTDRLRHAKDKRPLLNSIEGDLQVFVHKKLMERASYYTQAKSIVPEENCNKKDIAALVGEFIQKLAG